jgi:hypothetical protein
MDQKSSGIHPAPSEFSNAQLSENPILQFFHYSHLPPVLRASSSVFCSVASWIVNTLPRNAERTVALRKLLEAKDAAVRANLPAQEFRQAPRVASEQPIGEAREIINAEDDRDGPIPFGS